MRVRRHRDLFDRVLTGLFASNFRMSGFGVILFCALHGLQNLEAYVRPGSSEILPSIYEPLEGADEEDDAECNDAVVCQGQPGTSHESWAPILRRLRNRGVEAFAVFNLRKLPETLGLMVQKLRFGCNTGKEGLTHV